MKKNSFTSSAAVSKTSEERVFEWYFLDQNDKWTKYGDTDSTGNINFTSNITSSDIEKEFISDRKCIFRFKNKNFEYELDFSKMLQRNLKTGKEREVQRRLQKQLGIEVQELQVEMKGLPAHWNPMKKSDSMVQVLLSAKQEEYAKVERKLIAEVANATVISIKRIQNPFLFRSVKNKKDELLLKYGNELKLNIQQLFHGTKSGIIENICKENFDWRLHGTSTGQLYGRGTYFSNSAAYSHNYSPCDSKGSRSMMVARVIVGYTVKGDASMARPPLNITTGMLYDTTVDNEMNPKIFVKYDKQEYYPEYIIEYKIKKAEQNKTVNNSASVLSPTSSSNNVIVQKTVISTSISPSISSTLSSTTAIQTPTSSTASLSPSSTTTATTSTATARTTTSSIVTKPKPKPSPLKSHTYVAIESVQPKGKWKDLSCPVQCFIILAAGFLSFIAGFIISLLFGAIICGGFNLC